MVKEFNENNFEEMVINSGKPAVIDFYAEWCAPCRMVSPIIEELAKKYSDKVIIGKVNVDNASSLAAKYGIFSIPTILFFKDGNLIDKQIGAASKNLIEEKLLKLL